MADKIKTLENLKRMAAHRVEVIQKELVGVLELLEELEQKNVFLQKNLDAEAQYAGQDIELLRAYEPFAKRTKIEMIQNKLDQDRYRQQEEEIRAKLGECFAEEKRYQVLLARREAEVKKQKDKKQQQQLDEVAADRFRQES